VEYRSNHQLDGWLKRNNSRPALHVTWSCRIWRALRSIVVSCRRSVSILVVAYLCLIIATVQSHFTQRAAGMTTCIHRTLSSVHTAVRHGASETARGLQGRQEAGRPERPDHRPDTQNCGLSPAASSSGTVSSLPFDLARRIIPRKIIKVCRPLADRPDRTDGSNRSEAGQWRKWRKWRKT
jgi:hypothetical protein